MRRENRLAYRPSLVPFRLPWMAAVLLGLTALSASAASAASADSPTADLEEGFRNPPRQFSMVPLWSWNGRLEPDEVRRQIDLMVEQGVYGAFMHARAGIDLDTTPYFSDGWWKAVEAAVEHASKAGFAAWIYDEDKWPSGAAGGRTIERNPIRNRRKGIVWQEVRVSGPKEVAVRFPRADWILAGRLVGENQIDPDSLVEITELNRARATPIDPTATRGLRVTIVHDALPCLLAARCVELGCLATAVKLDDAADVELDKTDVLVSDVGTVGTGLDRETLMAWIRAGGGYVDFSHSEPTGDLYKLTMVVEPDAPDHRWLAPDHAIATIPNANPDADYEGRRWSDQWWRGGDDFDRFDHVLADPRRDPPGVSILARTEGSGRVVYCGATQACREPLGPLELLQNLLVYASGREAAAKQQETRREEAKPPWRCPEGDWIVLAFSQRTYDGVNYLNPATVRDFMDITHEEYARRVGKHFGATIPGIFFDEIHNSGVKIVWVEGFAERFQEIKGYDLRPLLPALFMDVGPRTPQVRCDYYDVYTTLYEEAWFKQIADWCAERDLELTGHTVEEPGAYLTQGDYFRTIRRMQIPGTDNEDFRYRYPRVLDPWKPRQLASISHVYGWPRAGVEGMGGAGWSFTLDLARYGHNMLAAHGINFFMPHLFHYAQDRPENVDDWPNSWFFRNPYWKYFKTFADHSSRLSFMLTGGRHVVDVAVLYPQTNLWAGHGAGSTVETIAALVAAPIDADLIDPDSLLRAEIRDKTLSVAGMEYRVLVVPGVQCIRRSVAEKILAFRASGGVVLVHDRLPNESMDAGRDDPEILALAKRLEAAGVQPIAVDETVALVARAIPRDLLVTGDAPCPLRYQHVRRDALDVYWLANGERKEGRWPVSFRAVGRPSLWQPEDGSITPISAFVRRGDRTECDVRLDGWQGTFVVFDTRDVPPEGGARITSTSLERPEVTRLEDGRIAVAGLLSPDQDVGVVHGKIVEDSREKTFDGGATRLPRPPTIPLDGPWQFLPVASQLDRDWRIDVSQSELAIPVMRVQWERGDSEAETWCLPDYDDSRWRQVKLFDPFHPDEGARRYRSRWLAHFISHYNYRQFKTRIGGRGLACRKTITLPGEKLSGWLAVVCPGPFQLTIGDATLSGEGGQPQKFDLAELAGGDQTIVIRAKDAAAILAEGQLQTSDGQKVHLFTDATWEVSLGGKDWQPAWEYVAPPEKPFGEPAYPIDAPEPRVVWYRQPLPPGAVAVGSPKIEGRWQAWVDGVPLKFKNGLAPLPGDRRGGLLAIRVETDDRHAGLLEPVTVSCRPVEQKLGSWTEANLDWYTGRAIYATTFNLTADYALDDDLRLRLDLGNVCWCAEVWLNGKLVGTRVWPPYEIDVGDFVQPGENRLDIVVANLLANRMRWDIFDDVRGVQLNRKWHDGNILRDRWCLQSGLIGPVRLVPFTRVDIVMSPTETVIEQ